MGDAFGFEKQHDEVSQKCGELALLPAVRAVDKHTVVVTDGFSYRGQVQQAMDRRPMHFAELCKTALDEHGALTTDAYPERRYVTRRNPPRARPSTAWPRSSC